MYNDLVKDMRSVSRFDWSGRLFQSLELLYEKCVWPFDELFVGIMRSVVVF